MILSPKENRNQLFMTSLDSMVDQDSAVRVIDAFLDYVSKYDLGFVNHDSTTGRPAFPSHVLIGIYVYGYLNRIRSSRQLEKACKTNVELFWLTGQLQPCYKTIANFRKDNAYGFRNLFVLFRDFCKQLELYGKKVVAIDGSKFRGVNSMKNNYNIRKIEQHLEYIEKKQKEYFDSVDEQDKNDDKINSLNKRKEKYSKLKEQLQKSEETQISTTDPDARALPLHMRIVQVGYNLQSAVDDKHNMIVDYQVTNKNDHRALSSMALKSKKALDLLEQDRLTILADKGYHTGQELQTCHDHNIDTIVAIPRKSKQLDKTKPPFLQKENFRFNQQSDTYTCPVGNTLTKQATYKRKDKTGKYSIRFDRYSIKHSICQTCPHHKLCVSTGKRKASQGRYIDRYHTDAAVSRNKELVYNNKGLYKRRQAIVEHPFGTIKRQWGFTHTLMKSIPKVQTEFSIITLCYNIRRAMSILSHNGLKLALKKVIQLVLILSSPIELHIIKTFYNHSLDSQRIR